MKRASRDRLDTAGQGLVVIALVSVMAMAVIAILSLDIHGHCRQKTHMWIKSLTLQTPAVVPSGHVLRNNGYAGVIIDRRQSPYLPLMDASLENMVVGSLNPARGGMPSKD
ncbi:hypothetical protein [Desulforapulum autotrophicum]|uniref:hypothetical protein n=1 Tax=Desulforapulum autotrophicum TaxID=2296 RepID=UPI000319F72A|nr:hypothetical protein [Desulforapulum autotrophicum]